VSSHILCLLYRKISSEFLILCPRSLLKNGEKHFTNSWRTVIVSDATVEGDT